MTITAKDIIDAADECDNPLAPNGWDDEAWDRLIIRKRWPTGIICPHCYCNKYYRLKIRKQYKCANSKCYKKFSFISGTVLENIKIDKQTFFILVLETLNEKNGNTIVIRKNGTILPKEEYIFRPITAHYNFNITYKTAHGIMKKIRSHIRDGLFYLYQPI